MDDIRHMMASLIQVGLHIHCAHTHISSRAIITHVSQGKRPMNTGCDGHCLSSKLATRRYLHRLHTVSVRGGTTSTSSKTA